jgi:hypothetical protein
MFGLSVTCPPEFPVVVTTFSRQDWASSNTPAMARVTATMGASFMVSQIAPHGTVQKGSATAQDLQPSLDLRDLALQREDFPKVAHPLDSRV